MLKTPSPGGHGALLKYGSRWLAAALLVALGSCSDENPAVDVNDCGGNGDLTFDEKVAAPGKACGVCGEGLLVCDGTDALRCEGARDPAAELGATCGPCEDGTYQCSDNDVACVGASANNACGGCTALSAQPGEACEVDGVTGQWQCAGTAEVACVAAGPGACGGETDPEPLPGTPCGACSLGRVVCDGPTDVACENGAEGLNACDSCGELTGAPGDACGDCGGELVCFQGGLICYEAARNRCGGCGPLEGNPGDACADGFFVCTPEGGVVCQPSAQPTNACGGVGALTSEPGEACGACGDGWTVCASPEQVVCSGARDTNACGGCGPMLGVPGEICATEGWAWTCTDDKSLTCADVRDLQPLGLVIEPEELTLSVGEEADLTAWLRLTEDTREDRTADADWTTDDSEIATVEAGRVKAVGAGAVTITAEFESHKAELQIVIQPAAKVVVSLSIEPSTLVLSKDSTGTLQVQAHYDDGSVAPFDEWVSWSVENPAVATIADGVVSGLSLGTTGVTATFQTFTATAVVEVKAGFVSLVATANPTSVKVGQTAQLQVTGTREGGAIEDVTTRVVWTVSPSGAGTVDAAGHFTSATVGVATVQAELEGLTASVEIEVLEPTPVALRLQPETVRLEPGATEQLRAIVELEDGSEQEVTLEAQWFSVDTAKATVAGGVVTAVGSGNVEIRATYQDLTATAQVQIPMGSITSLSLSPGVPLRLTIGTCVPFEATAVMATGETVSVTSDATWTFIGTNLSATEVPGRYCVVAIGYGSVVAQLDDKTVSVDIEGLARPAHYAGSAAGTVLRQVTTAAHYAAQPDTATAWRRLHAGAHFAEETTTVPVSRRTYPTSHFSADPRSHHVERP